METAVGEILKKFKLSDGHIHTITKEVEKWVSCNTIVQDTRTYQLQLKNMESRLERLTDALIDQLIDKTSFQRRQQKLLLEQTDQQQKLVGGVSEKC